MFNDMVTTNAITYSGGTSVDSWQPSTTYHYHWNGCGCGSSVVYHVGTGHEHDYAQAIGADYEGTLYCRKCGDTKALKPRKAKAQP